jgi:hypothetical protein
MFAWRSLVELIRTPSHHHHGQYVDKTSLNILLCPLKVGPYALKTMGIGIMTAARQASSVPAHCTPRFSNISVENKGNPAATAERSIMLAATVEAALVWIYLSAGATRNGRR